MEVPFGLREDAQLYTHEELSASHAMVLDCLEEYEERISRIEYCLIDLCFALCGFICDMEFSQLKKEFQKDLEKQVETNIDTESPVQGGGGPRARRLGLPFGRRNRNELQKRLRGPPPGEIPGCLAPLRHPARL